jgi:hypothetical protein
MQDEGFRISLKQQEEMSETSTLNRMTAGERSSQCKMINGWCNHESTGYGDFFNKRRERELYTGQRLMRETSAQGFR